MQPNEGKIDRTLRVFIGLTLLILAVMAPFASFLMIGLGIAAGIVFLTAATGTCPLYLLLRINTNRHKPA